VITHRLHGDFSTEDGLERLLLAHTSVARPVVFSQLDDECLRDVHRAEMPTGGPTGRQYSVKRPRHGNLPGTAEGNLTELGNLATVQRNEAADDRPRRGAAARVARKSTSPRFLCAVRIAGLSISANGQRRVSPVRETWHLAPSRKGLGPAAGEPRKESR
jgi:hypothetical protein